VLLDQIGITDPQDALRVSILQQKDPPQSTEFSGKKGGVAHGQSQHRTVSQEGELI
jgi:hypothetical protein